MVPVAAAKADDQARQVYGTAFQGNQGMRDFQGGATTTATQAYQVQAMRNARLDKDVASGDSLTAFTRDLQLAAGATYKGNVQYGGVADFKPGFFAGTQKVPIPKDVNAAQFTNLIKSIDDPMLQGMAQPPVGGDGRPVTAQQLQGGTLMAVGHGRYAVALGDPYSKDPQWVMAPSGDKFVLDLDALAPQLRYKLPGAYR
jgi:hypothetical protein